jgi:hypothetical protein
MIRITKNNDKNIIDDNGNRKLDLIKLITTNNNLYLELRKRNLEFYLNQNYFMLNLFVYKFKK